jgi:puromycin-sensitive aminopeptidase
VTTAATTTPENPYRLPRNAVPNRYDVILSPDLEAATFSGSVRVAIDVISPTSRLVLNALDLTIDTSTVSGAEGPVGVTSSLEAATERLVLDLSTELPVGPAVVELTFAGVLNDQLKGFYRSTFRDEAGIERVIATTQMQSTDCRRAFPCWDEPDFKAVFGITLAVEAGLLAISNSPEAERTETDGRTHIRFADTMVMPTYLVAFVVGPLEATDPVDVNGTPLRVVYPPGKGHLTEFALDCGRFCLAWFEEYYGIPYPGDKVDLVGLPDFAAGAMENLGCITFRESLLLVDPAQATQAEVQVVADVISHELAHMWFGDLVTMRWWNGIWLNEAFATFMEIMACDAYRPDWERWISFGLERTVAFETDSLAATRTVEFEVRSPADCEGMFDVLTYQKGGALLRMLQQYLGEDQFRAGVKHYLTKHSYGNTETSDLWDAIEEATGQPARRLMDSWIWQAGYPLVSATVQGDELVLRQQRFGFTEDAVNDPSIWVTPIHISQRVGEDSRLTRVLLESDEIRVPLRAPDAIVVVNADGPGFYRVAYREELLRRLDGDALARLSTLERYNLVDDAWSAVVAGRLDASEFLAFADGFAAETNFAVWQALAGGLRGCGRLLDGAPLDAFRMRVRALAGPALARLGWEPDENEDDLTSKLRGLLVGLVAVLGADQDAVSRARALFEAAQSGSAVDPELVAAATSVVASTGSAADFERFVETFRNGPTPQEQLRALYSLAEFDDAELIRRAIDFAMSGEVKTQNAPFLIGRCIANRTHGGTAWRILRERWAEANERFPTNTIVRMIDPVKLLNKPEQEADVQGFFAEHGIPQAVKTLEQVLERQRVNVALREREHERLATALSAG